MLLEVVEGVPSLCGEPWRGDLGSAMLGRRGPALIDALFRLVSVSEQARTNLVIAIDAPLGVPDAMAELLVMGLVADDFGGHEGNRYLLRETEMALIRRGFREPLSAVRQARPVGRTTKAMHHLRAAGFSRRGAGVWHLDANGRAVTALETSPAVIATARVLRDTVGSVEASQPWLSLPEADEDAMKDIRKALACAVLAHLWADRAGSCEPIPEHASFGEGWIVVPAGIGV